MKFFRHALFALLLLLTQIGALTHAVEHLRSDVDTPTHTCALCIAAQGLDAPLVSAPSAMGATAADFAPPSTFTALAYSPAAVSPRARAPPAIL
jgi:hypothetical protein